MGSEQWERDRWPWTVGSNQWAINSGLRMVGCEQGAVGSRQWAVGVVLDL